MEMLSLLRTLGALGIVLGMLTGALWVVRRYDIRLPGRIGGSRQARVELVQKLALDNRRSLALIRRDGREHLILLAPEGALLVEGNIGDDRNQHRADTDADADADRDGTRFAALVSEQPSPAAAPKPERQPEPRPGPLPAPPPTLADMAERLRAIVTQRAAIHPVHSHV